MNRERLVRTLQITGTVALVLGALYAFERMNAPPEPTTGRTKREVIQRRLMADNEVIFVPAIIVTPSPPLVPLK